MNDINEKISALYDGELDQLPKLMICYKLSITTQYQRKALYMVRLLI